MIVVLCAAAFGSPAASAEPSDQPEQGSAAPPGQPDAAAAEAPQPPVPEAKTPAEEQAEKENLLDRTHGFLARLFSDPAVWFDSFFGDRRFDEEGAPGTFVRWRNALRWSEDDAFVFITRFHASVRLPQFKRKLRVIVSGEGEKDQAPAVPGDPTAPVFGPASTQDRTDVGLLYDLFESLKSKLDIGAGVRLRRPVQLFVRARFRYLYPLGASWLARFTETVFEKTRDGFSEISQLDIERPLSPATLFRLSNAVTYAETKNGIEWVPGVSVLHELSPKDAISFDVSALVVNRPNTVAQNYRVGTRYRRNFYRPWLFFELEPEVTWPLDENGNRHSVYAFTFLIEIQFERPR